MKTTIKSLNTQFGAYGITVTRTSHDALCATFPSGGKYSGRMTTSEMAYFLKGIELGSGECGGKYTVKLR